MHGLIHRYLVTQISTTEKVWVRPQELFFFIVWRHFPWQPCDCWVSDTVSLKSFHVIHLERLPHIKRRQPSYLNRCYICFQAVASHTHKKTVYNKLCHVKPRVCRGGDTWVSLAMRWAFLELMFNHFHCIWIWGERAVKETAPHMETVELWAWGSADDYVNQDEPGK